MFVILGGAWLLEELPQQQLLFPASIKSRQETKFSFVGFVELQDNSADSKINEHSAIVNIFFMVLSLS